MKDQLEYISELVRVGNLEFTYSPQDVFFSKVLYKSFLPHNIFREKVYSYILKNLIFEDQEMRKLKEIFFLGNTQNYIFHFGEDMRTQRYKFYISLYDLDFNTTIFFISEIKKILGVTTKYYLEKNFIKFDCLGFDIKDGKISLKIYEITSFLFPQNYFFEIIKHKIKEQGVLKDFSGRKKYFYRFSEPIDISFFSKDIILPEIQGPENYNMSGKVKYFCEEGKRQEYYFG